jgi:hypothetical protein
MQMKWAAPRTAIAGLAAIGLSGCSANTQNNGPDLAEAVPRAPAPMICNAPAAQYHVGHDATQAMGQAVLKDSGARTLRWGPPDGAWTMDYRQDRVNVRYDDKMKIVEITCG